MRAKNILATTSFTPAFSFTTGFPTTPTLLQPPHATINVSTSPILIWAKESVATSYRVQLAHGSTIIPSNTILDTVVFNDTTLQLLNLLNNKLYYWRVRAINQYGSSDWSTVFGFKTELTTNFKEEERAPEKFNLEQNYPNPFNPLTSISFKIKETEFVSLKIFDVLGNEVKTLVNEIKTPGIYYIDWKGDNNYGEKLSSGIYFYRIQTESFVQSKKLVLQK